MMRTYCTILFSLLMTAISLAQFPMTEVSYDKKKLTKAKLTGMFSTLPTSGYYPVRLEVKNAAEADRKWKLVCVSQASSRRYSGDQSPRMESEFEFVCPGKSSKTYDFLVPVATVFPYPGSTELTTGLKITMTSDGNTEVADVFTEQSVKQPATLIGNALYVPHSSTLNSRMTHAYGSVDFAGSFIPDMLPADWKGYVGYDVIVCTDTEWMSAGKAVQNAILEWNRLGGELIIFRSNAASNMRSLDISEDVGDATKMVISRSFGKVRIKPMGTLTSSKVADDIFLTVSSAPSQLVSILSDYDSGGWALQNSMQKLSFNPIFLIIILIAFGVLVGPVNLFVFAKAGQRHKLFITTPIIAIGASLLLILIIILQDGFGGHGKRALLVEVRADNGENKAYVMQEQIARTGVILGSSFETSNPCYITPVPLMPNRFARVTQDNQGGAANYVAKPGEKGLNVSGDWFESRSEHGHYLESVIPTRGRITLKSNSGAPILNSSMDYKIELLLYCDASGNFWRKKQVEPGDSVTMTPLAAKDMAILMMDEKKKFSAKMGAKFTQLWKRKGHFVALTDEGPGIDTLDSIDWQETHSVITGPVVK